MSTEGNSERPDVAGKKPEHQHRNGLADQYHRESAPPRHRFAHSAHENHGINYNAMEPEYEKLGLYLVKPTDNWNTIVSMSLRAQHKESELNDPYARNAERERIELATEQWRKSGDPNAHVEHATFQVARAMILNMRSAEQGGQPADQNVTRPTEASKPGLPPVTLAGSETTAVPPSAPIIETPLPPLNVEQPQAAQAANGARVSEHFVVPQFQLKKYVDNHRNDVSQEGGIPSPHPIVSKAYGSDYGAMGLLVVDQKHDTWRSIARRTLAYQGKEYEVGNVQAENKEIARLMWNAEQFQVGGYMDPSLRVAHPHVLPLKDVGLIPFWDKSIGPDPKHLWRAPDAAQPGELYHAGYGDRVTALAGSRVIASPGADVNYLPGSSGFVAKGAHAQAAADTLILTNGADVERAPGSFVKEVSLQNQQ
jgi:hypothetical protein